MKEQLLELFTREAVVQAHADVRLQFLDAAKGCEHGNRDDAARRPLEARPRPDRSEAMLEQELPQVARPLVFGCLVERLLRHRMAPHLEPDVATGLEALVFIVRKFCHDKVPLWLGLA